MKIKKANKVLINQADICSSWWSKAKGLIGSNPRTLVFTFNKEKKVRLHMIGVGFPIDVIFLNKQKEIVEVKKNLKPFQFYTAIYPAKYVIESPKGLANQVSLGETLTFSNI